MKAALRRLVTMSGVVAAMAWPAQPAHATVTLEAQIVDVTCTVTALDGTTTATPCTTIGSSASSWAVMLQQGWSAQMVATIDYAYADDGLPLPELPGLPGRSALFQMDESGAGTRFVDHEAGALYAMTSNCGYYCATDGDRNYIGWSGFPPVFLSDNDEADRLNGTLTVATGASFNPNFPNYPGSWGANIFISLQESTWSVEGPVGVILEPSTFVLMLLGLGAVASAVRRRSRRTINR